MAKIDKTMTIGEVLSLDINTARIFMQHGMHCVGCPASVGESVEEASMVHGLDSESLIKDLNAFFDSKNA